MRKFLKSWWATVWVGVCAGGASIGWLLGGKVYKWEAIVWAGNAVAWTVLAEVRYRTGKMVGRNEERERQEAWWH